MTTTKPIVYVVLREEYTEEADLIGVFGEEDHATDAVSAEILRYSDEDGGYSEVKWSKYGPPHNFILVAHGVSKEFGFDDQLWYTVQRAVVQ